MVWLASWIPIGLWAGDVDFVLTPASRDTAARQLYQILFYSGLLVAFALSWRRDPPPKPGWGKPSLFLFFFLQGLIATAVFRWTLYALGYASWQLAGASALFWLQVIVIYT